MADPLNVESDLSLRHDLVMPAADHFIRSHFEIPDLALDRHRFVIDGEVEREMSLGVGDLRAMAADIVTMTMECAGNGRAHLDPPVNGVKWVGGAVGTSIWRGVSLGRLLAMARVREGADGVLLRGADQGVVAGDADVRRLVHFERSLPLQKALAPEVLIATEMDGGILPVEHGGPLRAVVAGWYGMASVKWLTRATVTRQLQGGFWETDEYAYFESTGDGKRLRVPVTQMLPKAQITEPVAGASVPLDGPIHIRGFAWAGEASVSDVAFSDDAGANWSPVRLLDPPKPCLWTRWEFEWRPDRIGEHDLLVRCQDDRGRAQPFVRNRDRGGYMINEVTPYPVTVRG